MRSRPGRLEGVHGFLSDPRVMRWIHLGPEPFTSEQSRTWIQKLISHNQTIPRSSHNSVIVESVTGNVVGWIGFGVPRSTLYGDLDFGYAPRHDCWGRGYMTEAVRGLLDFIFTTSDANVVFAECDPLNVGSYRVMEKAGMARADASHTDDKDHRAPQDGYVYVISRASWRK